MSDNQTSTRRGNPPQHEGLRETIDSIVIAFILAFVFRAFIVEAFVIPTGSMAPTLNGAHGTMLCSNCGWEYAYGLTDPSVAGRSPYGITQDAIAVCPNCRHGNRPTEINDARGNAESGDRILVLKWPLDVGGEFLKPKRWDVTVFKDPSDGTTNYIKRLAGLPGEVLEIIDGDLFTAPASDLTQESLTTLDALRHLKYLVRTASPYSDIRREEVRLKEPHLLMLEELASSLTIKRKSDLAQEDLWRPVYNHDYSPKQRGAHQPYWQPDLAANSWTVLPRTLEFSGLDSDTEVVRLAAAFDSLCSYNTIRADQRRASLADVFFPVSDLRLQVVLEYTAGDGELSLILNKRNDEFVGRICASGEVAILRGKGGGADLNTLCTAKLDRLEPGEKRHISLQNLDYRVRLMVDGREVLATTDEQYSPDVPSLRHSMPRSPAPPAITAARMKLVLSHVIVEKDIYYVSDIAEPGWPLRFPPWGTRNNPILLRDGEYFMLGDNSAQSKDSRLWDHVGDHLLARGEGYQLGTVPEDQLIGRAFFVYWPSGLRTSLIPFLRNKGLIPNIGRMRWIR